MHSSNRSRTTEELLGACLLANNETIYVWNVWAEKWLGGERSETVLQTDDVIRWFAKHYPWPPPIGASFTATPNTLTSTSLCFWKAVVLKEDAYVAWCVRTVEDDDEYRLPMSVRNALTLYRDGERRLYSERNHQ